MGYRTIYEYSPPDPSAAVVASVVAACAVAFGLWIAVGAPRRIDGKWRRGVPHIERATGGLMAGLALLVIGAGHARMAEQARLAAYLSTHNVLILEGRVDSVAREMNEPTATENTSTDMYWYYTGISVDGRSFKLGPGSSNPSLIHYNYSAPLISEGDNVRISYVTYVKDKILKIEVAKFRS